MALELHRSGSWQGAPGGMTGHSGAESGQHRRNLEWGVPERSQSEEETETLQDVLKCRGEGWRVGERGSGWEL